MPTIDDLKSLSKKKFIKSDYRPWNYMDELDKESNGNQLEINRESIGEYIETESGRYGDHKEINKDSIGNQSGINDHSQSDIEDPESTPIRNNSIGIKRTTLLQNNESGNETQETTLDTIFRLTGHQKKIFLFVADRCASRALLSTGVIKGETLAEITNTTLKMVKTSIQRLVSKQLIIRERGKTGRGGFYSFRITEIIRNATLEYKRMVGFENQLGINKESIDYQLGIKKESTKIKKIDTNVLPDEWMKINILPLEEIGFNHNHLADIFETNLADPQMVQESILHFAYGLEYESAKYKQYNDLLNVLIGRLRKGKIWSEKNYRSPQEIAQTQLLEAKKMELDRKKKIEEDAFKLALAEWQENLSQEDLMSITAKKGANDITPQSSKLSIYYRETLWPSQKKMYLITN